MQHLKILLFFHTIARCMIDFGGAQSDLIRPLPG